MSAQYKAPDSQVKILDGNMVADNWAHFGPWIMSTMEHDLEPIDAVQTMQFLRADKWICLGAYVQGELAGIALCSLSYLQCCVALEVKALAGEDFDRWIEPMWVALKLAAHSHKCRRIYLRGRMGWIRRIRSYGFRPVSVTMAFDLYKAENDG